MKLLIITQKVNKNDPILGFFHRWIIEFAKHVEQLTVICLEEGVHELPQNVRVLSLGKDQRVGRFGRVLRLYKYVWQYRHEYTHVFVHMNPVYVILCWKLWFMLRKPVFLWYTHKHVDWKLRMASWFVRKIFTASAESLRLNTKKKVVTGHGIDTDFFAPDGERIREKDLVLTVGRVSAAKNIDTIIHAVAQVPAAHLEIVGDAITAADKVYKNECVTLVEKLSCGNRVTWCGAVPHRQTIDFYQRAHVFINMSDTGSLDKVLLEALASELPVLSSNDAACALPSVVCTNKNTAAQDLECLLNTNTPAVSGGRQMVIEQHGLGRCVTKLVTDMSAHV